MKRENSLGVSTITISLNGGIAVTFTEKDGIRHILLNYTTMDYKINDVIDTSHGERDIRKTYCLTFEDNRKFVLKAASNSFTTPSRVKEWQNLSRLYKENGIYCPQIINTIEGQCFVSFILEGNKAFICYLEEDKKYKTVREYIKENSENKEEERVLEAKFEDISFRGKVLETIGIMANVSKEFVCWPSPYCLYDIFCEDDKTDENYEFAEIFYNVCKEQMETDKELLENIWNIYIEKKSNFEEIYRKLPKTVFQCDLNLSNILIDENLEFAGIIDFNLSGTETIINYAICESIYYLDRNDIENLMEIETLEKYDSHFSESMKKIKKHYKFNEEEKAAFTALYNIVSPFRYPNISLFINVIENGQTQYINSMLQWILRELTRNL